MRRRSLSGRDEATRRIGLNENQARLRRLRAHGRSTEVCVAVKTRASTIST